MMQLGSRHHGKIWEIYKHLLEQSFEGRGNDTLMICYPNAPFHYKEEISWYEIDGVPKVEIYKNRVYDYPIKTINEWIEIYHKNGFFVR